ncbi:MAG: hypothetical protein M0D54_13875 [Hyphomonadaceae bacterium JAD_PAG50586_4]|nr:MAG: hypothetical protein M0D54_13875 [Hyphomonadaceae bacterium JAD_PAG50586_4]
MLHAEIVGASNISIIADVALEHGGSDVAIRDGAANLAVVRCVDKAAANDHAALATMLIEGPFKFAALLCEDREASVLDGPIPAFHVSEVGDLVARLVREASA